MLPADVITAFTVELPTVTLPSNCDVVPTCKSVVTLAKPVIVVLPAAKVLAKVVALATSKVLVTLAKPVIVVLPTPIVEVDVDPLPSTESSVYVELTLIVDEVPATVISAPPVIKTLSLDNTALSTVKVIIP